MAELKIGIIVVFIVAYITSLYAICHLFNHDCIFSGFNFIFRHLCKNEIIISYHLLM